jgi:hypothetical protein
MISRIIGVALIDGLVSPKSKSISTALLLPVPKAIFATHKKKENLSLTLQINGRVGP